jgi:hypothetical protein
MAIKKVFAPIMAILESNLSASVADVIEQVRAATSAKTGGGGGKAVNFVRNEAGIVTAVKCYAFDKWMDPRLVPFGAKANTPTGLNTMCKAGVSVWTQAQSNFKKGKDAIVGKLLANELTSEEAQAQIAELEAARTATPELPADIQGFDTLEDCQNNSVVNGLAV